jgi:hypothetical protein
LTRRPTRREVEHVDLGGERRGKPVKYWAGLGAIVVVLQAYLYISWIRSSDFAPVPKGPDKVPGWMATEIHVAQIVSPILLLLCVYFLLIRPWVRSRRLSLDGMFIIGFLSLYWQDLLVNYIQPISFYNTEFFNRGSWYAEVPGWVAPHGGRMLEPLLLAGPFYVYGCFGITLAGCYVMRKTKARWPNMGKLGLMSIAFAFFCLVDFVLEPLIVLRLGWWAYTGAIKEFTIFHGEYYQFPLYGMVLFGATLTAWASLRFYKNDKGQTFVERGIDDIQVGTRAKTGIRLLAVIGVLNAMWMIYMIPIQPFAMNQDAVPKVFENRAYLTNGWCGPSSGYACPGPAVPIPRPSSARLGTSGQFQAP